MATACLFLGWGHPRDDQGNEAFRFLMGEGRESLAQWKKEGWFESSESFGLTPHMGALGGFILVKGERAKLDELRRTDAFERFSMRMNRLFAGYGVVPGVTEEVMKKVMERNPDLLPKP